MALVQSRSLPACPRKWASPTVLWALCRNCSRHRTKARLMPQTCRSPSRYSGSIQCSIRFGRIRALRNLLRRPRPTTRSNEAYEFGNLKTNSKRLSADGLVMAETAFPHVVRPGPREEQPTSLDRQRLDKFSPFQSAEKDRNRAKQLVIKRQPFHHRLHGGWHDVDRKHLAAEEIFERINDENDCRDFQNPKRHHRKAVSDKELNKRSHEHRHRGNHIDQRIGRQHDVVAEINKDQRNRRQSHEGVNEAAT